MAVRAKKGTMTVTADQPGNGGDVGDMPMPPLNHAGQHERGEPHWRQQVHLHQVLPGSLRDVGEMAGVGDTGVVDQDVYFRRNRRDGRH